MILFCCCASVAFSLELELIEGVGNLAYDRGRTSALSDETNPGNISPMYYPLILARFSGEFSGLRYSFGYEQDPRLRNRLFANIRLQQEYFFVEAGPVIGLFNTDGLPVNPGISGTLGLMLPGKIFAEASGSSTLAAIPMEKKGNYSQISADLSAGFWVPYVICSFNLSIEKFTLRKEIASLIEDEFVRYYFRADAFTKNFPYTMRVDIGFQNLKRSYSQVVGTDLDTITDEFKSVFVGLEGTFTITPGLKLFLGAEMPVYSWSERPMKDPPKDTIFFEARVGIIWTLPAGNNKKNLPAEDE